MFGWFYIEIEQQKFHPYGSFFSILRNSNPFDDYNVFRRILASDAPLIKIRMDNVLPTGAED